MSARMSESAGSRDAEVQGSRECRSAGLRVSKYRGSERVGGAGGAEGTGEQRGADCSGAGVQSAGDQGCRGAGLSVALVQIAGVQGFMSIRGQGAGGAELLSARGSESAGGFEV